MRCPYTMACRSLAGGGQEPLPGWYHSPSLFLYLCQRHLRLGEPERHLHRLVHLDGRREFSAGRLPLGGLAEQPQGVCLIGLLLAATGACQGTLGKLVCLLQAASQEIRFAEMDGPERIRAYGARDSQLYGLFEQWLG